MRTLACLLLAGCVSQAQADHDRFRRALAQSPELANPARSDKVDHTPSGNWDSSFMLESYAKDRMCVLAEWNVPSQIAPGLTFFLAGWPDLDHGDAAPHVASDAVEVLDAQTVAKIKHYDVYVGEHTALVTERPDKEQAAYDTAMRVCFRQPEPVLAKAQYLVITVDADGHHRTGAGWHLH